MKLHPAIAALFIGPAIVLVAVLALLLLQDDRTGVADIGATATAALVSPSGEAIGTVSFTQGAAGVLIAAEVRGLTPGGHGFFIHETGACTPDFAAAGDHFNPEDTEHGLIHPNWKRGQSGVGGHGGDLPNIYAGADGSARADFFTDGVTLDAGARHSVFDADGSAIVVHEKPDAYGEEESDTGSRVACGIIRRN